MNIKSMLARLECAMNRTDLSEQMILLPQPASKRYNSDKPVNLVVGYNASPQSQAALDLTLWIAHQSRLVAKKPVTVQVVYVMAANRLTSFKPTHNSHSSIQQFSRQYEASSSSNKSATSVLTKPKPQQLLGSSSKTQTIAAQSESYKQADRILSQASCLAQEWRGDFKTHLRFGDVANQLRAVVESTSATALFLGCNGTNQGIVQEFGDKFPCSILGIPDELN